jgi:hypothetical protein
MITFLLLVGEENPLEINHPIYNRNATDLDQLE